MEMVCPAKTQISLGKFVACTDDFHIKIWSAQDQWKLQLVLYAMHTISICFITCQHALALHSKNICFYVNKIISFNQIIICHAMQRYATIFHPFDTQQEENSKRTCVGY